MGAPSVLGAPRDRSGGGRPWRVAGRGSARLRRAPAGPVVALLALYACWGSSIPAIKIMVGSIPPLAGAGIVFCAGGVVLLAIARPARTTLRASELRRAALVGGLLLVGGQGLATVVLTEVTASLTAILVATIPLVVTVLGALTGTRVGRPAVLRLLLGFGGIALTLLTAPAAALGGSASGIALLSLAITCWASGTLLSSRSGLPGDVRVSGAAQLLTGGTLLLGAAAVTGQLSAGEWAGVTGGSIAALVFLLAFDSVAGFVLYGYLLRTMPVSLVSTYAYATPVLGVTLGVVALGEPLWPGALAGGAIVLAAVTGQIRAGSAQAGGS